MQWLARIYIDIPALRPGTVGAYTFGFLCTATAMALRIAIDPYVTGVQYITFYPAIDLVALISGLGAGLFCVALSAVAATFLVPAPELPAFLLFILAAVTNVILIAGLRFAVESHRELGRTLEQRVEERSAALRESEEHLRVLVQELQHRTRNLIGVVGVISDKTLKKSKTIDDYKASFRERLGALGRAQELLSRMKEGGRVTFDQLINTELEAQSISCGRR
jgi:hypothetical protein